MVAVSSKQCNSKRIRNILLVICEHLQGTKHGMVNCAAICVVNCVLNCARKTCTVRVCELLTQGAFAPKEISAKIQTLRAYVQIRTHLSGWARTLCFWISEWQKTGFFSSTVSFTVKMNHRIVYSKWVRCDHSLDLNWIPWTNECLSNHKIHLSTETLCFSSCVRSVIGWSMFGGGNTWTWGTPKRWKLNNQQQVAHNITCCSHAL